MLDLSKRLPSIEGLTLFEDHADKNLVYYLPDEVSLRRTSNGKAELSLQIFFPSDAVEGTSSLDESVGAIFAIGVECTVTPERYGRVLAALKQTHGDEVKLTEALWRDGRVDLILLDQSTAEENTDADRFVRSVVGTKRPSLTGGQLGGLFHARLDSRGAELVEAALKGSSTTLAGILYDLQFAALRPSCKLKMTAELTRVGSYIQASLGVNVTDYVSADISAAFDDMTANGVIEIDLVDYGDSDEERKAVEAARKDFYDKLMRELFRPTINPARLTALGPATPPSAMVTLGFRAGWSDHKRTITIDYRGRSTTLRPHNPNAHLSLLGSPDEVAAAIQRVRLSDAWRQANLEIAAPSAFTIDPHLRELKVEVWRARDGLRAVDDSPAGGLRRPDNTTPLAALALSADDAAPRSFRWITERGEAPGFYWQAEMTFATSDGIDSPTTLWTPPQRSSSTDLNLYPDLLAPVSRLTVALPPVEIPGLESVQVEVTARDTAGAQIAHRTLQVQADAEASWAVRRPVYEGVRFYARQIWRFDDGRMLTLPERLVPDATWTLPRPFAAQRLLSPVIAGVPTEILQLRLTVRTLDPKTGFETAVVQTIVPPDFLSPGVRIPVVRRDAVVTWQVQGVSVANGLHTLASGTLEPASSVFVINLNTERRIKVLWLGPSPDEQDLKRLHVEIRSTRPDGTVLQEEELIYKGNEVEPERLVAMGPEGTLEYRLVRRFSTGERDHTPWEPIVDGQIAVVG